MTTPAILVFDDDADILAICQFVLDAKGYKVITRSSCDDVLNEILQANPAVIIMDNKIPPVGGVTATKYIKADKRTAEIPVIFFSANTQIAQLAEEAGADVYLQKPFDISELEQLLEKILSEKKGLYHKTV